MTDFLRPTFELATELLEAEAASPVQPPLTPGEAGERVDLTLPRHGLGRRHALRRVAEIARLTPRTSDRRFFNQLFAGREPSAGAAEMVTGLLNVSMYTYKVAGVHTLIENEVIGRLCALSGFPDGEGTFVPGGSLGNLVGLVLAAFEARPALRDEGLTGARLRIYLSEDGHYSVRKNAGILGLGRANVRRVPVDVDGRMEVEALRRRVREDRDAGHQPLCVVATAGTTVRGAFDPVRAIAGVAREEGLWLHVDGAFGGTFLLHPELRSHLDGVELADSFTWNAHKMMGIPLPCAAVLVRRSGLLARHFNEAADYLFQQDDEDLNLGTKSIQCGRRNDAFKLWAAWQELGDDGWARRIDRQRSLLEHARLRVDREPRLELACEPSGLNLCFVVRDRPSDVVCERLGRLGLGLVGYGVVEGRKVIRLVTVNPEVGEEDLDVFFDALLDVAAQTPPVSTGSVAPA